jgi:ATP-dependent helicase HepA
MRDHQAMEKTNAPVPGQRWISETEPELGLGTVLDVDHHRISLIFIASEERRTYARSSAPLTRVRFVVGDTIENVDGQQIRIARVDEHQGILTYTGKDEDGQEIQIEEIDVNHFHQFNRPQDRLFAGKFDDSSRYHLRMRTRSLWAESEQSPFLGLLGPRTSLIAHQLYIAHEVASRHRPRVLLADEVGLGKTIEAGLILHHQLLSHRVGRVLVILPDALVHQWLIEMRRRFSLNFSVFDEERCQQTLPGDNPFSAEQLVLCSLDFLMASTRRQKEVLDAGWDMVIVDEAHHLTWDEHTPSPAYEFIEQLGAGVPGLLLLTATPEQLGKASHFARLRLLDPDRFNSYESFMAEEASYGALASVIDHLLDDPVLDTETLQSLGHFLEHDRADSLMELACGAGEQAHQAREELIQLLLDRHGTGRVLFRNTRATVRGFPRRHLHACPLPCPENYRDMLAATAADGEVGHHIHPESMLRKSSAPWWSSDSRIPWLVELLQTSNLKQEKILIMAAEAQTAMDIEAALRRYSGRRSVLFHEGMTLLQRDRAAAWFAEEDGASLLICSEIGSEGRNFQFAHHMVLFDLPLNPDLLEQRIGRLDRIGQSSVIHIHVPYFENSAQHVLFDWYHHGLNAFEQHYSAGSSVFAAKHDQLVSALRYPENTEARQLLVTETRVLASAIEKALHDGRDRLLEMNSCNPKAAQALVDAVVEADDDYRLWRWLESVFDSYGISVEEHSENCYILKPGEHLRVSHFPGVPDEGVTVTLDRGIALAREDMLFLSWEHPMVRNAMDLVLNGDEGNVCISLVQHPDHDPGEVLIEINHRIDCAAPRHLQLGRFMPHTLLTARMDGTGYLYDEAHFSRAREQHPGMDEQTGLLLVTQHRKNVEQLLRRAEQSASQSLNRVKEESTRLMLAKMTAELKRLSALRRINRSVRQEEIDLLKQDALEMHGCIAGSVARLDSIHLMFCV